MTTDNDTPAMLTGQKFEFTKDLRGHTLIMAPTRSGMSGGLVFLNANGQPAPIDPNAESRLKNDGL